MTTALWLQRLTERSGSNLAARIDWMRHRHHCYDPEGGPMQADINEAMDALTNMWADAGKMRDEADEAEAHAQDLRFQAEDILDKAEEKAKEIIESRPEWLDALLYDHVDPRVARDEAAFDESEFQRTGE